MNMFLPSFFIGCSDFEKEEIENGCIYICFNADSYKLIVKCESPKLQYHVFPNIKEFLNMISVFTTIACEREGNTVSFLDMSAYDEFSKVLKLCDLGDFQKTAFRFEKKDSEKDNDFTDWIPIYEKDVVRYGTSHPFHDFTLSEAFVQFARKSAVEVLIQDRFVYFQSESDKLS